MAHAKVIGRHKKNRRDDIIIRGPVTSGNIFLLLRPPSGTHLLAKFIPVHW